jgi:hypothetical protein
MKVLCSPDGLLIGCFVSVLVVWVALSGCVDSKQRISLPQKVLQEYSALYKSTKAHDALSWIADNYISNGMPFTCVEEVLGKGDPYYRDNNTNHMEYYGIKADPSGRHLIIHITDSRVSGLEWVSE